MRGREDYAQVLMQYWRGFEYAVRDVQGKCTTYIPWGKPILAEEKREKHASSTDTDVLEIQMVCFSVIDKSKYMTHTF